MKLHLFNPENDLALGLGCRHYTPPPHATAIHRAGALLPAWWAGEDDLILAPPELGDELERLKNKFGLKGTIYDNQPVGPVEPSPWGWSADAKRQFLSAGISESCLPDDHTIGRLRELSHRRMSIEIIRRLDGDYPLPMETADPEAVVEAERRSPGCFIKSPWSGSGRGVFCARSLDEAALTRRVAGIINRQGSVMVERGLDKTLDFAALFHSAEGKVEFRGLSVFKAETRGMYSGNIVAPQETLRAMIGRHVNLHELDSVIRQEENILTGLIADVYEGWLGIDMLAYREDSNLKLMPCVELNLRMTMGVVAMKIQKQVGSKNPRLLAWYHNEMPDSGTFIELLPPSDDFALLLGDFAE